MAPLPWILITPASRGIGFSLTRLLLQKTSLPIVATARGDLEGTKARLLAGLDGVARSRLSVLEVDVTSYVPFPYPPLPLFYVRRQQPKKKKKKKSTESINGENI